MSKYICLDKAVLASRYLGPSLLSLTFIAASPYPASAEPGKVPKEGAKDLDVMSITLSDVVKPQIGLQGKTQAAGTPNQAGLGGFLPLSIGKNSVFFLDVLANANLPDIKGQSSIVNTDVDGITISTSSRLGYRWLNGDRSWMYGINAGYDTRPMSTGATDTGIDVSGSERTVFFQQAAVNIEAMSDRWRLNAYGLIPVGDKDQQVNWYYMAGALQNYGVDAGYKISPSLLLSLGGYYQYGDVNIYGTPGADGLGVQGRLAYDLSDGLTLGANLSYDDAFDTRFSADLTWRYGSQKARKKKIVTPPVMEAMYATPGSRDVRVHDCSFTSFFSGGCNKRMRQVFAPVVAPILGVAVDAYKAKSVASATVGSALTVAGPMLNEPNKNSISDSCNGYIGKWYVENVARRDCSGSIRDRIQGAYGSYIPDIPRLIPQGDAPRTGAQIVRGLIRR